MFEIIQNCAERVYAKLCNESFGVHSIIAYVIQKQSNTCTHYNFQSLSYAKPAKTVVWLNTQSTHDY